MVAVRAAGAELVEEVILLLLELLLRLKSGRAHLVRLLIVVQVDELIVDGAKVVIWCTNLAHSCHGAEW